MNKHVLLNRLFFLVLASLLSTTVLLAQNLRITGRVVSQEDGSPIPGVSILQKGTTRGLTTDVNGTYSIEVPAKATLTFSYIGYTTQDVNVGNRTVVDVTLVSDNRQLNEVVVTAYGSVSRSRNASSITTVKGAEIANLVSPSFDAQLAGRAAGVQVTVPSGIIGQAPRIRIRGTNSISSGASPLIVVDGVPINTNDVSAINFTNPLADINPQDIESYDVLKDGAAAAIYGSRAANGVILITTKKGKRGTPTRVNLNVTGGTTSAVRTFDLLNNNEFVVIANEKIRNSSATALPQAFADPNGTNTNWQDYVLRTGVSQDYNLNVSGGTEKTSYYYSLGYQTITGPIKPNGQTRYSFATNLDHTLNKAITVGAKVQVSQTSNTGLNAGSNALSGNIFNAIRAFPNVPIFDATHPTGYNISSDGSTLGRGANLRGLNDNPSNIAFAIDNNLLRSKTNRILANAFAQVNFFPWLNLRSQIGADYSQLNDFQSLDPRHGDGRGSNGSVFQSARETSRWNWQNVLTADHTFSKLNVLLTLGNEFQKSDLSIINSGGSNFSDRFFIQNGLIGGTYGTQTSSGTFIPTGFDSYFGRVNLTYNDKYTVSLVARNDGLSSLPLANRRGTFFGGSASWRLSQEDFFKNLGLGTTVNELKLRASYAQVGNVDIGSFPYVGVFTSAQYASQNGIAFGQAGNPDLQWEASTKESYGLDFGLLGNRLTGSFDYFRNNIDKLILAAPTAPSLGIPGNSINRNVGAMVNQGVELTLNFLAVDRNGFRWTVGGNVSTVQNRILALNKDALTGLDQPITLIYTRNQVGSPISAIYGYVSGGVNPANGNPLFVKGNGQIVQRNAITGTYSFYNPASPETAGATAGAALSTDDVSRKDANGNTIGDRQILGNANPTWFGGLTNSVSYKGFDLEVFIRFSGGNKIMNVTRQTSLLNQEFANGGRELLNRWTPDNRFTDVPRLVLNQTTTINLAGQSVSRFVESGDFVRIQNISLGYNIPKSVFGNGQAIRSVRLFAQVQNAFTFTKYTGLDPELVNSNTTNSAFGIDFNTNPIFRSVNFGANFGF